MHRNMIYICSRLRGDYENNQKKAQQYCRQVSMLNLIPIAPHIYFPQFLDDDVEQERLLGISMDFDLLDLCQELWVFDVDGISEGMRTEIDYAQKHRIPIYDGFERIKTLSNL